VTFRVRQHRFVRSYEFLKEARRAKVSGRYAARPRSSPSLPRTFTDTPPENGCIAAATLCAHRRRPAPRGLPLAIVWLA
jgi:hypothetical protein